MLVIPRRGHRTYIYGPDIFAECIDFLCDGKSGALGKVNFSVHDRVTGSLKIELNPPLKTMDEFAAVLKCRFNESTQILGVRELDPSFDTGCKIYDEDALVADSRVLNPGAWQVGVKGKSESFLHIIVGLNKKMLTSMIDMPAGSKWSFVRLVASIYCPEQLRDNENVTLHYQSSFNDSLFKTKVEGLGDLYFHLTRAEQ